MNREAGSPAARERRNRLRPAGLALLPYVLFLVLAVSSWKAWVVPFADGGREMNTPLRLAAGESLYRDVGSYYGPWPPYLDAVALRLLGVHLDVLFFVRAVISALGIEALRRLALRVSRQRAVAAAATTLALALCAFDRGGFWLFPYSVAALEGAVASWWALLVALTVPGAGGTLAAGLLAGLAAGAKLEFLPVIAVVAAARAVRHRASGAAASGGLALSVAALSWGLPWAVFGTDVLRQHGFLISLRNPQSWRLVQQKVFFGGQTASHFLDGGFVPLLFPSVPFLGGVALLFVLARRGPVPVVGAAVLGLASALIPENGELHALLPLGLGACAAYALAGLTKAEGHDARVRHFEVLAVVALGALLAARQPFSLPRGWYSSFTAPLAICTVLALFGASRRHARLVTAFVLGLAVIQAGERLVDWHRWDLARVRTATVDVRLPASEATFLREAISALERDTNPGDPVAVFPEPGFLLFATGRTNPFPDEQFHQGVQEGRGEPEMISRLRSHPPVAVLVTDRSLSEHGPGGWGHGILDAFFRELHPLLVPKGVLGDPSPRALRVQGDATSATYWLLSGRRRDETATFGATGPARSSR